MESTKEEINQYLTEAMGECWHETYFSVTGQHICKKCEKPIASLFSLEHNNFFTWEGFGKLWEWSITQPWFEDFWFKRAWSIPQQTINPELLAKAIYKLLKGL